MAALPAKSSPTVDAIYASYAESQESGYREHLGASIIGTECERALWYGFRWTTRSHFEGRLLRLFQTGHLAEARFVADLRGIGATVLDVNPDTGKQWNCRDESGHFGGSADGVALGVLEAPKTWHLCEFKTHGEKSFNSLEKYGIEKSKPLHFAQMQTYMHLLGLERGLYMAVNKNTDELYSERIHYDIAVGTKLVAKAARVINAPRPPAKVSNDPAWFMCRFCDHATACHGDALPKRHCRSCLHSTPVADGKWHCGKHNWQLSLRAQSLGCSKHLYIPDLVPGKQIDVSADGERIVYAMRDGKQWQDGLMEFNHE